MTDKEINTLIAEKFFGYRVQVWSIHSIDSYEDIEGNEWRHGVFSHQAFALNQFPCEVLLPDDEGDMPITSMLVEGMWYSVPEYDTDPASCALVLDEIEQRGWYWDWSSIDWDFEHHYVCTITPISYGSWERSASDDNRYRAVCVAALAACGAEVEQ